MSDREKPAMGVGSPSHLSERSLRGRECESMSKLDDNAVVELDAAWDALTPASLFLGWDHLEWWVGNARQAAAFMASCFGFRIHAYAGPETGRDDGTRA